MSSPNEPSPAGKPEGDQSEKGQEPGGSKSNPHKDKPDGKDFGADDDTPQQGGM